MALINIFVDSAIVAVAGISVGATIAGIKGLVSMRKDLLLLVRSDVERKHIDHFLVKMSGAGLRAQKATLEALDGTCNGNIKEARIIIEKALKDQSEFLEAKVGG